MSLNKKCYSEHFQDLIIRHDYLKKIPSKSKLDIELFRQFTYVIKETAFLMYQKYQFNYDRVGLNLDDITGIANIYAYSYIMLYSIYTNPESSYNTQYINSYTLKYGVKPTADEIKRHERNKLINFIRQKLSHCSVVCEREVRNVIGNANSRVVIAETKHSKYCIQDHVLLTEWKKLGYRAVTRAELKRLKKECKEDSLCDDNGYKVLNIQVAAQQLSEVDFVYFMTPDNSTDLYSNSPEDLCLEYERQNRLQYQERTFYSLPNIQKIKILQQFINTNKHNKLVKKEKALANSMLKALRQEIKSSQNIKTME